MANRMPLARYLFTRLRQHGVHSIPGVPGDFTLRALDELRAAGIRWVGTTSELSAGYAADGFARVAKLGALVTTYGVGDLSAINALAGSMSEGSAVANIVGTPRRALQDARANVHHTLGDGRPRVFAEMNSLVTVKQANLVDETTAPELIDRTLEAAIRESKPVYIELPADMVMKEVASDRLAEPLDTETKGDETLEDRLIEGLLARIYNAQQPLLLVDSGGGVRHLRAEIEAFVSASGVPTLCMPSGSGMVSHSLPNYFGVHSGPVGQIDTMPYVSGADLVIAFGPMFSDTQTLSWKVVPEALRTVTLEKDSIHDPASSNGRVRTDINLRRFLDKLTRKIDRTRVSASDVSSLGDFRSIKPQAYAGKTGVKLGDPIDQTSFYLRLSSYLRPHDVVILGNATPILGGRDLVLPEGAQVVASGQWFSIGHMLPAAMGISLARQPPAGHREGPPAIPKGRTILLDGDGGFQVTAQELSTIIRYRLPMTIFLINNAGYAYERLIHGPHEDYNDLAPWRYGELARAFGAPDRSDERTDHHHYPVRNYEIATWGDLEALLADEDFCRGDGLRFVDVRVGKFDVPEKFKVVFQRAGEQLR